VRRFLVFSVPSCLKESTAFFPLVYFFKGLSNAYINTSVFFLFMLTIVVTLLMYVLTSFCHNNTEDVLYFYCLLFTVSRGFTSLT
jgi:hypothetical protein